MSKSQTTFMWSLSLCLGVSGCFASTSTLCSFSTSYAQDYPPHPAPINVSMSDPAACDISDYSQVLYYGVGASASTNASGGTTGSIGSSVLASYYYQSNPSGNYFPPNIHAETFASADIDAEFTTSGPLRPGILTFTYSGTLMTATYDSFVGSASLSITDGIHSHSDGPEFCGEVKFAPIYYHCPSFTMPIELGSPFYVESDAKVDLGSSFLSEDYHQFGESGTFTLQELDGTAVDAILVATPEPASFGLSGIALVLLIALLRYAARTRSVSRTA